MKLSLCESLLCQCADGMRPEEEAWVRKPSRATASERALYVWCVVGSGRGSVFERKLSL